jgi:hypothetical protein
MLTPLRRSLGERILESSANGRICIRSIHVQNPIRGAAAAQVQINDDYLVKGLAQLKPQNKRPPPVQQKFRSPPSPIQPKSSQAKNKSKKQSTPAAPVAEIADTKEAKLSTATQINSPYLWSRQNILSLYSLPDENVLPVKVEFVTRSRNRLQGYHWQKEPLNFLEKGLKLNLKIDYVSLEKSKLGKGYRVRILANWSKNVGIAIGDGPSKVQSHHDSTDNSKLPPKTLQYIFS